MRADGHSTKNAMTGHEKTRKEERICKQRETVSRSENVRRMAEERMRSNKTANNEEGKATTNNSEGNHSQNEQEQGSREDRSAL